MAPLPDASVTRRYDVLRDDRAESCLRKDEDPYQSTLCQNGSLAVLCCLAAVAVAIAAVAVAIAAAIAAAVDSIETRSQEYYLPHLRCKPPAQTRFYAHILSLFLIASQLTGLPSSR
jgi:hypothetical protein